MKLKNKGKVYPSPSYSSSDEDYLSILKLLPAAILALASVLSLEDLEVLAYMITRSLKTTTTTNSLISQDCSSKNQPPTAVMLTQKSGVSPHKPPVFDCDCFDCYTSYWFRWDSSPNRELIHQVIEAFEDHLTNGEAQKPFKKNVRPKRRDSNCKTASGVPDIPLVDLEVTSTEKDVKEEVAEVAEVTEKFPVAKDADVEVRTTTSTHNGLARKVLPDVLGLFNSRLWGLWNPNL